MNMILHPRKQLLFALLSFADLSWTWWLLDHAESGIYESNPIANWWLQQHGWLGLIGFKIAIVCLVLTLALVISRRHPRAGGAVLGFGCAVLLTVVVYSVSLSTAIGGDSFTVSDAEEQEIQHALQESNQKAAVETARKVAYWRELDRLSKEVMAGHYTLQEAAMRLEMTERVQDGTWQKKLASLYPGLSPQQCLAMEIVRRSVKFRCSKLSEAHRVACGLEREFQQTYGVVAPREQLLPIFQEFQRAEEAGIVLSSEDRLPGQESALVY